MGKNIPKKGERGGVEEDGAQARGPLSPDSPRPPRFQTRCGGRGADWRRQSRTPALPAHTQEGGPGAEVTAAPRAQANRKCPFCSAETLTPIPPRQPPSEAPRASAGGGARGCRGRSPPHPGPEPGHPNAPAPNRPKFTSGGAFPGATWPGSAGVRPGPGEDSAPRTSGSKTSQGKGRCKDSGGARGSHFLAQRILPSRTPSVLGVTSSLSRETAPFATVSSARHPLPGGQYLSGKTPNSSRGRTPVSSTPPGSPRTTQAALWGDPRAGAKSSGRKCPGASRDSRLRAPRPALAARAACARELRRDPGRGARTPGGAGRRGRRSTWDSPSARPPRRGGEGREGEDTIWQSTAAAPGSFQQPPPGRRGHEQAAAAAVPAAAVPHPPPPAGFLPLPPPFPPLPWQRGAKEISPAPPSLPRFPPPAASRVERSARPFPSPPTSAEGPGSDPEAAQEGG